MTAKDLDKNFSFLTLLSKILGKSGLPCVVTPLKF